MGNMTAAVAAKLQQTLSIKSQLQRGHYCASTWMVATLAAAAAAASLLACLPSCELLMRGL
jgi:hypothetical protein